MKADHQLKSKPRANSSQPKELIRNAYIQRKAKNDAYSLRAFARDLGMSQALLSLVINGQRPLTLKQAHKIGPLLGLGPLEQKILIEATLTALPENAKVSEKIKIARLKMDSSYLPKDLAVEKFSLISTWYHLPILDLTTTDDFQSDITWIAERIGISKLEAEAAVERLLLLGLLEKRNGKYKKTARFLKINTADSKAAVRNYHDQMIEKAQIELKKKEHEDFLKRSITGTSFALDLNRLSEAKRFIQEFEQEFIKRFTVGEPTEVYQFNVQLFPLTQTKQTKVGSHE